MAHKRRKKCPTEHFTATVTTLSHDGRGIAHIDGKTTFLFGGLPEEAVEFQYQKIHSRYDEGKVVNVTNASPDRTAPRCKHYGICGGCSLQHIKPEAQIQHKLKAFLELMQHAGCRPTELLPPITGNPWGYRRKARLSIKFLHKKDKVLVGFRERNGRFVANLERCDILDPSIGEKISAFSDVLYQLKIREQIPQIEIAVGDEKTAIIIRHLVNIESDDLNLLREFVTTHNLQLYLQPAGPDSIHLDWPTQTNSLLNCTLPAYNLSLQFHPNQFIQVNQNINDKMIAQALELLTLTPTDRVLDLYCGIGNFSLPIAKYCQKVIGVEGSSQSVQQATNNARLNHIDNAEFFCTDLSQPTYNKNWAAHVFDKIVLDPPRTGAKEVIDSIPAWKAKRIVYISCNPATLARDAKLLQEKGYNLEKAGVMDMFPHTQHVEAIALFIKK
ncbi:23S rRNA (uracil(1939)-C(5))-methyltransferase RlmD [Candidiatus Paracoxiella cheracis]|uniref:23S rRNA (uracil(1939)-C(5))-methyltransferase RlmD n=1 Tax=Candidiatus Paracoxiella cheracis TaxID=3405120 RepID=UPI003BF5AED9